MTFRSPSPPLVPAALLLLALLPAGARAQSFVEYPAHPATYGDHTVPSTWVGGPSMVTVTFLSDEAILHGDGNGQSQRTARNTLNYVAPSAPENPQDYDDLRIIGAYGSRLPLLQEMAANGTCTLRYAFSPPVTSGFDLFVTDVDTADSLVVAAFDGAGAPLDMTTWTLRARGDLSLYKDTGTAYSPIVAPNPILAAAPGGITLVAVDGMNYNRSFSILAAPGGGAIGRVDITFTGIQNSASRAAGGTGSHIYVALSTTLGTTGVSERRFPGVRLLTPGPATAGRVALAVDLAERTSLRWSVHDVTGRRVAVPFDGALESGVHELAWDGRDASGGAVPSGVYFLRLDGPDAPSGWTGKVTLLQ